MEDTANQQQPLLLPKLQTALAILYNYHNQNHTANNDEAHQFLLSFKSSNLRRFVVSRIQSQKDRSNNATYSLEQELQRYASNDATTSVTTTSNSTTVVIIGSIYLSCLSLLLNSTNSHERIFAAQTLNHRCRSMKLVECYDIEAEDGLECGVGRLVVAWDSIGQKGGAPEDYDAKIILDAWRERYVPMLVHKCCNSGMQNGAMMMCDGGQLLATILEHHSTSITSNAAPGNDNRGERGEEQTKGQLVLMTLAVALYCSAFAEHQEEYYFAHQHHGTTHSTPWANAVVSELGSALSVTALRIRYRPSSHKNNNTPESQAGVPSLIDVIMNVIHMVADTARHFFMQQQHHQQCGDNDGVIKQLTQVCHVHAIKRSIAACLTSLPETVLLPPNNDRGDDHHRIPSIDRACLRAASIELRCDSKGTGMERMFTEMLQSELEETRNYIDESSCMVERLDDTSASRLLECCESWARFVTVPLRVIDVTVGRLAVRYFVMDQQFHANSTQLMQYQKAQNAAFQYLTSIFEGASPSLTVEDILSATLGVAASGTNGKKRQGNKSKKRQDRRLKNASLSHEGDVMGNTATDVRCSAEDELCFRKNTACLAAAYIFGVSTHQNDGGRVTTLRLFNASLFTHNICSTVSIAASSVLPRLLCLERNANGSNSSSEQWWLDAFETVLTSLRRLCQSSNRDIRGLSYEPLMLMHESLNSVPLVDLRIEQIAIDAICELCAGMHFKCSLALSGSCQYPPDYFQNLAIDSDGDLEIERNDVRDVIRSVSNFESGNFSQSSSLLILEYFINSIDASIQEAASRKILPQEGVAHALSALAKPLNKLAKKYGEQPQQNQSNIMTRSLQSYSSVFQGLNSSFHSLSISQVLPVSRLALIGLSSIAPMLSSLVSANFVASGDHKKLIHALNNTLKLGLEHSIAATSKIPELAAESTLKITRYDIRGTMRGPGGEDHVGCIALMRLSFESDNLAYAIMGIYGSSLFSDIARLYNELKNLEQKRPLGCDFGTGSCPISRRLVLRALSRLCMLQIKRKGDGSENTILNELLKVPLAEISTQRDLPITYEKLLRLCESIYDLASLDALVVANAFVNPPSELECVFQSLLSGYSRLSFSPVDDQWFEQWARLRGAVVCLLRTCCQARVTVYMAEITLALVNSETEAAINQCNQSPLSVSSIFNDSVVGEEVLSAGVYMVVIRECLIRIATDSDTDLQTRLSEFRMCLSVLASSSTAVTALLLNNSSEAKSHRDPRDCIAESWFQSMSALVSVCKTELFAHFTSGSSVGIEDLIGASLNVCVSLVLMKDLGNKHSPPPTIQRGMSLDGPQTLAMTEFMVDALSPSTLAATARSFAAHFKLESSAHNENLGASIISAGLLRAASGALPPWAVELTPAIFKSLYVALGSNSDVFIEIVSVSTKLESSGEVLAGRYFGTVSSSHIKSFLSKTREACNKGEWNKMKSIIKTACGGKKKESGFNLKPQFTCWDCERL